MDALLQNKAEHKFLLLFRTIATTCRAQIEIEIEPRLEGGLLNRYRIKDLNEKKNKQGNLSQSIKVALLTAVFLAPTTIVINGINEIIKSIVSEGMKDNVKDNLEKEKLQLEIEKIRLEINDRKHKSEDERARKVVNQTRERLAIEEFRRRLIQINQKSAAIDNRLKFYKLIAKYPKISGVSTTVLNAGYLLATPEFSVERYEFINLANDMSEAINKIDSLSALLGENHYYVLKMRDKVVNRIGPDKQSDTQ